MAAMKAVQKGASWAGLTGDLRVDDWVALKADWMAENWAESWVVRTAVWKAGSSGVLWVDSKDGQMVDLKVDK